MKYSVLVIGSNNIADFIENSADGIRYDNLDKFDFKNLILF